MDASLLPRIAAFAAAVRAEVASIEWGRLTEQERVQLAVAWGGLERAVVGGAAGALEEACQQERGMDSLALRHGVRNGKQLLAMLTGSSEATAQRRIRLAQAGMGEAVTSGWGATALFPAMGQAVLAGAMHADAADALVSILAGSAPRIHPAELAIAEGAIVESATDPEGEVNAHGDVTGTGIAAELVKIQALLAALYGGCAWHGCTAPPAWTEAHHAHWHSRGGKTSVENGVPLCAFHHHVIHAITGWEITMKPTAQGLRAHLIPPFVIDPHRTPRPMGNPHRKITGRTEDPDPPPETQSRPMQQPTPADAKSGATRSRHNPPLPIPELRWARQDDRARRRACCPEHISLRHLAKERIAL